MERGSRSREVNDPQTFPPSNGTVATKCQFSFPFFFFLSSLLQLLPLLSFFLLSFFSFFPCVEGSLPRKTFLYFGFIFFYLLEGSCPSVWMSRVGVVIDATSGRVAIRRCMVKGGSPECLQRGDGQISFVR
ncbi:hypothetical protein F4809DRAFT_484586 [Biscogniauxia mediterranea]|nr:hypothetical protein F4809DRAFT_484586 [Biscogniauxia mediterranea]